MEKTHLLLWLRLIQLAWLWMRAMQDTAGAGREGRSKRGRPLLKEIVVTMKVRLICHQVVLGEKTQDINSTYNLS